MTIEPWTRLVKIAPPGTHTNDLQAAANRHALLADVYAAAADLWEDAAMQVDTSPDDTSGSTGQVAGSISSISQDGISISYSGEGLIGNNMSSRIASQAQMLAKARYFRGKAKPKSVLVHDADYDPWFNRGRKLIDPDLIIPVDEV